MKTGDKYFDSEDFQAQLQRYEAAHDKGQSIYMDPDELSDIAEYYYMLGNIDKAIATVEYGIGMFPGTVELLSLRARIALIHENDTESAKAYADRIVDTTDFDYYYIQAEIMIVEEKEDEAENYLENICSGLYDEEKEDFIFDVATLFTDYELYEKAEKWIARSSEQDAADYKELKGRIAMHIGNFEESDRIFNELIDRDPYSTPYWNHLASSQLLHNQIRDSISSSEFSIAINPDNEEAILNKANGLFSLGNFEEAKKFYKRYSELCPEEETGEMFQGICALNMDHLEEGVEHLKKAEEMASGFSSNRGEIFQELAFALSRLGKGEEALDYVGKMETTDADMNEVTVLRGHLLMNMGKFGEGQACYTKAIKDSDGSPRIFMHIAISIYDLGFYRQSYKMFQILRKVTDDTWTEGYSYEALCCYSLGKYDEFREMVRVACEKNPREAQIVLGDMFPEGMDAKDFYGYLSDN